MTKVYKAPPITEAVIGITFANKLSEDKLQQLIDSRKLAYPTNPQEVKNFSFNVELAVGENNQDTANTTVLSDTAHRLSSYDRTEILLVSPNSFVVSQTAPYPGWEVFLKRFNDDWKAFRKVFDFQEISRIGVRYINRIDIPVANNVVDFEEYLNFYPKVTDKYGPLDAYGMQVQLKLKDIGCRVTLNTAVVSSPLLNHMSFLLDQDIVCELDVPQRDDRILELLGKIRQRKNDLFEECITNKARGLFKNVE